MLNVEKLVKLLMLSTSDSDAEALSAIRAANAELKSAGLTWEDIGRLGAGSASPSPSGGQVEAFQEFGRGLDSIISAGKRLRDSFGVDGFPPLRRRGR